MLNDTKLKRQIIDNPTAEYILDNLSPVYGGGYVALHMINKLGLRMGNLIKLCQDLSKEGSPITATWSLDIWEDSLGLARDPELTIEQRRKRILSLKVSRFSSNPYKLKKIIKDFAGLDAEILENTARYTFTIKILFDNSRKLIDLNRAFAEIDAVKHAHIIYNWILEISESLVIKDKTDTYTNPFYPVGHHHKCGTIFKHQYTGKKIVNSINVKNNGAAKRQRQFNVGEIKSGVVKR